VTKKDSDSKQSNDLPLNFLSSEEMFNHAFEYAPIGMTIVGPKGDFWNANQAFCDFIGYSVEELRQLKVFDITYSEDKQSSILGKEVLLAGDTSANRQEKRYVRKDGTVVWGLMTRSAAYLTEQELQYTLSHVQDITELKKAQATLADNEERYERAISGTTDGIWEVNLQTGEDFKSPRWKSMLGYAEDEIGDTNEDFLKLLHPDDRELAAKMLQNRLNSTEPVDYTVRMLHKDGHVVDIRSRGQVFRDEDGAPLYMSGAHTDISDQLAATRELGTVRQQLVDAIECLPDAFVIYDAEDKLVVCNARYREYYSKANDLIEPGMKFEKLVRDSVTRGLYVDAEGREEEWVQERLALHRNPGETSDQELDDGRWLRVIERKTSDGGSVGLRIDITNFKMREKALSESEDRYRSLVETLPDAVVVVSHDQGILFANPQAAILYAVENSDDLLGKTFANFIHPDFRELAMTHREEREEKGHHAGFHLKHRAIDGRVFDAEFSAVTIPWDDREAGLLIIRDISELQELNRVKDEFVATVSHELRTPLTSIKGSLGLLKSETLGALPEQMKSMIEIAYNNSDRLVLLINDILDIQKFEAGRMDLNLKTIDPVELVKKSIEVNQGYSDEYKTPFVLKEANPGLLIEGDEGRLMQVLSNLLSNAAKFSPEGSTVELSVDKDDGMVLISVTDQGHGIAEENQDQIFEKFTQVDSTDTRQIGGTGLGLSISKSIVEEHGGLMDFESKLDPGSTFFFTLPIK
jgi:PAS domain S-box-containing protein